MAQRPTERCTLLYTCCVCSAVGCTTGQEKVGNKGQMKAKEEKVEGKWVVLHCLGMWYVDVTLLKVMRFFV